MQVLGGRALTSKIILDEVPATCHPLGKSINSYLLQESLQDLLLQIPDDYPQVQNLLLQAVSKKVMLEVWSHKNLQN